MNKPKIIPLRLRRQMRPAAGFLFAPWLLSLCFCWHEIPSQPSVILGLLPGLAVAVHIQRQLVRHLGSNHRRGEDGHLFATLGTANWITLMRAGAIIGLAGILPWTLSRGPSLPNSLSWAAGIVYLGLSLADLLDGLVARKQERETELGRRLDIESDAAGLLVASLVAVALGRLPAVYLLVGLAYYPFVLGIWLRQKRALPVIALRPRPCARIIAGFQMGLVGIALLPIFNPVFTYAAALIFMAPLLIGFLGDWLMVSCRVQTDMHRKSTLDPWVTSLLTKFLPMVLRLVILSGGIAALVGYGVYRAHPVWHLAHGLCCLLVGFGIMGRSAALLLTLMFGSNYSPFGASLICMVIFGTAATLMLTGTGAMSLWAPEETVLYRRGKNGSITSGEAP
ncbi:MAG: CDP-alcohol phosphatidyltransferase family protein [Desulfobacterales bacterium]|nr:CDP-alcohol phosphatidyltransferase family protein [Desulfobacterales bacterium]